jgi:hypothetical protein
MFAAMAKQSLLLLPLDVAFVVAAVLLFAAWANELPTKVVDKTATDTTSIDAITNSPVIIGGRCCSEELCLFSREDITLILSKLSF